MLLRMMRRLRWDPQPWRTECDDDGSDVESDGAEHTDHEEVDAALGNIIFTIHLSLQKKMDPYQPFPAILKSLEGIGNEN